MQKTRLCKARTRIRTKLSLRRKQRRLPPEQNFRLRLRRLLYSPVSALNLGYVNMNTTVRYSTNILTDK